MPFNATPFLRGYARLREKTLARKSAAEHQRATLMQLIRRAADTRFGREHGFGEIRTVADFQAGVPLRDFEDFREAYFAEPFPVLTDVTWPGTIPCFAVSSGTSSGRTKHIPVSKEMLRSNQRAGTDLLGHHVRNNPDSEVLSGKSFLLSGSVALEDLGHGIKSGDLSGIARLYNPRWSGPYVFPSLKEAVEGDWETKIDRLARLSVDEPIRCLAGTPSWLLLFFERLAAITGKSDMAGVFPGLDLVVYGGMSFEPYRSAFARWLPEPGVDWREVYSASEGFVASADRGIDDGMRLNVDVGLFFEFVPVAEWDADNPTRYWVGNAPAGEYGLVLSTCAGLWSYKIGDVVELTPGEPPRVTVTGRTSYYLSAFGEHLSGREIERAVLAAAADLGAEVHEFCATALYPGEDGGEARHLYVVELDRVPDAKAAERFAQTLDRTLQEANEDYEVHRRGDFQLKPPSVTFVPTGGFTEWMRARGKLGGQNKVPRVALKEPVRSDLLDLSARHRNG